MFPSGSPGARSCGPKVNTTCPFMLQTIPLYNGEMVPRLCCPVTRRLCIFSALKMVCLPLRAAELLLRVSVEELPVLLINLSPPHPLTRDIYPIGLSNCLCN